MVIQYGGIQKGLMGGPPMDSNSMMALIQALMQNRQNAEEAKQQDILSQIFGQQNQSGIDPIEAQRMGITPKPMTLENKMEAILAHPDLNQKYKQAGLYAANMLTKKADKRQMEILEYWTKGGQKRKVRVPAESYNNVVAKITEAGGTLDKPGEEQSGPFSGSGFKAQAYNHLLEMAGRINRGEQLTPDDQTRYNLLYQDVTAPRVVGTPEGGFYQTQMTLPKNFPSPFQAGAAHSPGPRQVASGSHTGRITPILERNPKPKAIPQDALKSLTDTFNAMEHIATMEKTIGQTGRAKGWLSKAGVFLGTNERAIEFDTARKQMKLAAQAMIKGIPSNFDVGTLIDTLPELTQPETVNKQRLIVSRNMAKALIKNTIAYYKASGYTMPEFLLQEAKNNGINIKSITPWDGKGDPLSKGFLSEKNISKMTYSKRVKGIPTEKKRIRFNEQGEIIQ